MKKKKFFAVVTAASLAITTVFASSAAELSGSWWTAWSESYELVDGSTLEFDIDVKGGDAIWNNVAAVFTNSKTSGTVAPAEEAGASYKEYAVIRGDNWGWGGGDNKSSAGSDITYDGGIAEIGDAEFIATMKDAHMDVTISRDGNDITYVYELAGANGTTVTRTAKFSDDLSAGCYVFFVTDNSKINIELVGKNADTEEPTSNQSPDTEEPDIDETLDVMIDAAFSAHTADETLSGDFEATYTFHNASQDTSANWNNFIVELFDIDGNYITMRADAFGVGAGTGDYNDALGTWGEEAKTVWTGTPADAEAWATWAAGMANADVTVSVKRSGNVLTFTYDIKSDSNSYKFVGTTPEISSLADVLGIHLTGEKVNLTNIKFTKNQTEQPTEKPSEDETTNQSPDTEEPDIEGTGTHDAVIGAAFTDNTGTEVLEGEFDVTYTLNNKSNGTQNWENFIAELRTAGNVGLSGQPVYIDVRADNFGWLANTTDGAGLVFNDGAADWEAWADAMRAGSDCTVNVKRTGNTFFFTITAAGETFTSSVTANDFAGQKVVMTLTGENVALTNVKFKNNQTEQPTEKPSEEETTNKSPDTENPDVEETTTNKSPDTENPDVEETTTEAPTEKPSETETTTEAPTEKPSETETTTEAPTEKPSEPETTTEAPTEKPSETEATTEKVTEKATEEATVVVTVSEEEVAKVQEEAAIEGLEDAGLAKDTKITATPVKEDSKEYKKTVEFVKENFKEAKAAVIDLKLTDVAGVVLDKQPDGKIKVTIPVLENVKAATKVEVFRYDEASDKFISLGVSGVKDGKIAFETDHFSTYLFVDASKAVPEETTTAKTETTKADIPKTGDAAPVAALAVLAMAAVAGIFASRKKNA